MIIYHFGGKDELIKELLQELIARVGEYMQPRIEAEQTGAGMLRAFIESNLAFMAENRNHVVATVKIALNARAPTAAWSSASGSTTPRWPPSRKCSPTSRGRASSVATSIRR